MTTHPSQLASARTTDRSCALLVTADPELTATVRRVNDQVDVLPFAAADERFAGQADIAARAGVLLLLPSLDRIVTGGERAHTIYLSRNLDDATVWRAAVNWRADHVVMLPDGESWLDGYLTRHLAD